MPDQPQQSTDSWERSRDTARVLSLTPFAVTLGLSLFSTNYFPRLISTPPDIVGVPLGLALQLAALGWAAIGLVTVWRRSGRGPTYLALLGFTAPAIVLIFNAPALILLMQNLAV